MQVVPLEYLAADEEGRIQNVDGDRNLVVRLGEMGFREGTIVRMVRPGSPCIVAIENQRISFRCEDSAVVLVEILKTLAATTPA